MIVNAPETPFDETEPLGASGTDWHDDPISAPEQDRLGRAQFSQHAARLIDENHSGESSVVYGLEGPWGSGKSSVISLTTAYLTENGTGRWKVVQFTPWATSGTEALLAEFFATLASVAPRASGTKALRERITSYADIARPIAAVIPFVGSGLVEATHTVEDRLRKPWNVAFAEVAEELARLETPILVVVDDIDRLQPAELLDLLKVVRLLGRFPGVDFLLAYDEQTLVETLQDPARGQVSTARARAFMEKIVQYPLSMPPLLTGKIVKLLDSGLTEILTLERVEGTFDKNRFGRIVLTTMPSQLSTPRAIERFLAQVRQQFRMHDLDEMDDVDLILATFLRVQFPDLFARLQRWKSELTTGSVGVIVLSSLEKTAPNWEKLLSVVEDDEGRRDARTVLETLFPAITEKNPARAGARRMAHPDYFDRYLAQTIPEGDIPDVVIGRALTEAATGDPAALRALICADDEELVTLALSKIRVRYPDLAKPWAREGADPGPVTVDLLEVGMALVNELEDRTIGWTSTLRQTMFWMEDLLALILDGDPGADVDSALLTCARVDRRAHVVADAGSDLDQVRPETQEALRGVLAREVDRFFPLLLEDLRLGDASEGVHGSGYLYGLVDRAGRMQEFQALVRAGVERGEFTAQDVGARLVGFGYVVGGPPGAGPSSAGFDGQLFEMLTGMPAGSTDHNERDEWPDTSWARRREFAAKYLE